MLKNAVVYTYVWMVACLLAASTSEVKQDCWPRWRVMSCDDSMDGLTADVHVEVETFKQQLL